MLAGGGFTLSLLPPASAIALGARALDSVKEMYTCRGSSLPFDRRQTAHVGCERIISMHVSQKPCPDGLFQLLNTLGCVWECAELTTGVKAESVKGEWILAYSALRSEERRVGKECA